MSAFHMKFEGEQGTGKPSWLIEPGTYNAEIISVEVTMRETDGAPFVKVEWQLGDGTKRTLRDQWPIEHQKLLWKAQIYQKAAGLPHSMGYVDVEPEKWIGAIAKIGIINEQYNGKWYNKVKNVEAIARPPTEAVPPPMPPDEDIAF